MIADAVERYLEQKGYERMALKAAMFDMDGVLFDSMKNHAKSWHETMAHFGLDLPEWEAYMHEGRTGAGTINIVSMRQRGQRRYTIYINIRASCSIGVPRPRGCLERMNCFAR